MSLASFDGIDESETSRPVGDYIAARTILSGFSRAFVGFDGGKMDRPDTSCASAINRLKTICRKCRVSPREESTGAIESDFDGNGEKPLGQGARNY